MNVAILSDIHDNIPKLQAALRRCQEAETLICCGDLCSPFIAKELGQGFSKPVHVVFGNNDGDRFRIAANGAKFPHLNFHGEYVELELGGKTFSVNHFDNIGRAIAKGGGYDVVCFGHNHRFEIRRMVRRHDQSRRNLRRPLTGNSTFVNYDTATGTATRIDL